jgi:hypothetical protein
MSRILRYKDSVERFIKSRGCTNLFELSDDLLFIKNYLLDSKYILPITILTILNSLNRKNEKSFQGYYIASGIEVLSLAYDINLNKEKFVKKHGQDMTNQVTQLLPIMFLKSFNKNMDVIKMNNHLNSDQLSNIYNGILGLYSDKIYDLTLKDVKLEVSDYPVVNEMIKSYLPKKLATKMDKLMAVNESDLDVFTSKKMCSLCEFVILIGWYVGCGESCYIDDIKKMSKHFGMMYQLAQDFINIESDLQNADKYTTNYVINIGTQHSYDKFMTHKQKFIQASLTLDTYSNTMKEIVDYIGDSVEHVIDNVSVDIRSQYSA